MLLVPSRPDRARVVATGTVHGMDGGERGHAKPVRGQRVGVARDDVNHCSLFLVKLVLNSDDVSFVF